MAIIPEEQSNYDIALQVAKAMVAAARTAPKGRGISTMHACIISGNDLYPIIAKMEQMAQEYEVPSFERDAKNIKDSDVLVLLGTSIQPLMLKKCGMCGFANCEEKMQHPTIPCVFNTGDLGIAIGSAVSVAMDNRVDNRIMYTVGQAIQQLSIFPKNVSIIYGIPLKVSSKNIFFDRN